MIQLADNQAKNDVKRMWKSCFNDNDSFIELYFNEKYEYENTLLYVDNGRITASLQMPLYQFTFYGNELPAAYITGACTLPEYRNKGYMGKLLKSSFEIMLERKIPLSILIPAEDWLFDYYRKYGYEKVFEKDFNVIPLKKILSEADGNIDRAYRNFDKLFRNKDFTVQKTKEDFITIIQDAEMDNFPEKTNLAGMARIIDVKRLLDYFAQKYPDKNFIIQVEDEIMLYNNGTYKINNGVCVEIKNTDKYDFKVSIKLLTQLLFGFHLSDLSLVYRNNFNSHTPVLNLMLE